MAARQRRKHLVAAMTHRERCTQMAYERAGWAMECYALQCDRPNTHWWRSARDWWASAFFWLDFAGELDQQD